MPEVRARKRAIPVYLPMRAINQDDDHGRNVVSVPPLKGVAEEREPLSRGSRLSGRRLLDRPSMCYHTDYQKGRGRWVWCGCFKGMRIGDKIKWPGGRQHNRDKRWAGR